MNANSVLTAYTTTADEWHTAAALVWVGAGVTICFIAKSCWSILAKLVMTDSLTQWLGKFRALTVLGFQDTEQLVRVY